MNFIALSIASIVAFLIYNENKDPKHRSLQFGEVMGEVDGIKAYSNYLAPKLENSESNYYHKQFTGIKWQCVEFVRRYLIIKKQITFDQVDFAYNIMDLKYFKTIHNVERVLIYKYKNGDTFPQINDLIIWDKDVDDKKTGHVAVILEIYNDYVKIGEQNWSNCKWEHKNYSRRIPIVNKNSKHYLKDKHIIGLIRF